MGGEAEGGEGIPLEAAEGCCHRGGLETRFGCHDQHGYLLLFFHNVIEKAEPKLAVTYLLYLLPEDHGAEIFAFLVSEKLPVKLFLSTISTSTKSYVFRELPDQKRTKKSEPVDKSVCTVSSLLSKMTP